MKSKLSLLLEKNKSEKEDNNNNNEHEQEDIINYNYKWDHFLKKFPTLSDNTDSRIILTILILTKKYPDLKFITYDSNCACLAKDLGINT